MRSDLVEIDVRLVHETEMAYLFDHGGGTAWVPKSQCDFEAKTESGNGVVTISQSLAEEKGMV